jgi:hypothetical protein
MKPGPLIMLVLGTILTLIGAGLVAVGTVTAVANAAQGRDGYFSTRTVPFSTDSYALTSPALGPVSRADAAAPLNLDIVRIRLEATGADADPVFIGIAPQADVERYLAGVNRSEVRDIRTDPFRVRYLEIPGQNRPEAPTDQDFWVESADGPGSQAVTWRVQPGSWAVVVMNADASASVDVDVRAGVRSGVLAPLATTLLIVGIITLIVGLVLVVLGVIGLGRGGPAPSSRTGTTPRAVPEDPDRPGSDYPARLTGRLDPDLSRALWLVKWVLVIPHLIVLFFLWIGLIVTTIVAGFAILFTGRYPRSIFNYNVGVLRWNWRVGFYAYSALGTDRYPPFTLAATDYPADLEVDYPERLSNGLVLVKWWLLVLPHLFIVAIITGGTQTWTRTDGDAWTRTTGFSLVGLLVVIAAVILLFSNRYRRGLFDLIIGLNRWVYRVIVYATLMRDEYPPFRLDQGPVDPGAAALQQQISR